MLENSEVPLLQHKKSKKNFLCKYAIFFTFICAAVVLSTLALARTRRETPIGDVNAYRHAEDDIPTPREVESDDAEEIEVGAITRIAKASGAEELQLCERLKGFTSDLSDMTQGTPLFGEELEYHNGAVSLDNGKFLYTTDGQKSSGSAGWGYTQILGRIKHSTFGTLVTIEGETQTRVEAFTAPVSTANLENQNLWLCAYELLAKLRATQGRLISLKDAINRVLRGLSIVGHCSRMSNELSVEYLVNGDGGKAAHNIKSTVAQLNFGVPIAVFDPMTVGSSAGNYFSKGVKRKKGYAKRIPAGLKGFWPLNRLSQQKHKDDLAKLQLIQDPIVRALTAFWREIHLTLVEWEAKDGGDRPYWKKSNFNLFPKHKFTGSEQIFTAASGAYDVLFPGAGEKYEVGHMYKKGSPTNVKPSTEWGKYGSTIRKDPWKGIRLNYADANDEKSVNVVQSSGQLFIVMETRKKGAIKDLLPSTKNYDARSFISSMQMAPFISSMQTIQSFKSDVQGRCGYDANDPSLKLEVLSPSLSPSFSGEN